MRTRNRLTLVSFLFLFAASTLQAITYIVPTDRDLVRRSDAIVVATAVESHVQLASNDRIVTIATLSVESVLKGSIESDTIRLVEMGGVVAGRATMIPGSPRYEDGKRYLVFLRKNYYGEWATYGFGLGKFAFVSDIHGSDFLVRGGIDDDLFGVEEKDWTLHVERLRSASGFMSFVRTVVEADAPASDSYFVNRSDVVFATFPEFRPKPAQFVPVSESTRPDYMLTGNYRWQSPTATFVYCCPPNFQPGFNGPGDVSAAMANWNSTGVGVNYTLGGVDATANKGFTQSDGKIAVLFNDPNNEVGGAAAIGGISNTNGTYNNLGDGVTYNRTLEVDVVVGKTINASEPTFILLLTHELGHTLGFRHSDGTGDPFSPQDGHPCAAPSPCANPGQAVMASVVFSNLSGLGQWDLDAVNTVYGSGPVCNAPAITTQPQSQSIVSGSPANLSVAANGTPTLTYHWYVGTSGTTTSPVGGATSTAFHPSPTATTSYWARVTNSCTPPTADSNTAVVTVTCASPSAASGPTATPSTITTGDSSTLSVTAGGSGPFTYQWYVGNSGVTTTPINGATGSSTSVSPAATTSYWVRMMGQCGSVDSAAVLVTVVACAPPNITGQPVDQQITTGGSAALNVSATGTALVYQWFIGNPGDLSNPASSATANSFVFVSPATTTTYWVRVTGRCGSEDSNAVTVTVTQACVGAAIGTQPASATTIAQGGSKTLTVVATGTSPITYQWYIGLSGDVSNPIQGATTTQVTVTPGATTSYWVKVSNSCGNANSNTAKVTVSTCVTPSITTPPTDQQVFLGAAATLKVTAAGTATLHYQWYQGLKGDTSKKVGTDSSTFTSGAISSNTQYWVRISNACGTVDGNTINVTLAAPPRHRAVRH